MRIWERGEGGIDAHPAAERDENERRNETGPSGGLVSQQRDLIHQRRLTACCLQLFIAGNGIAPMCACTSSSTLPVVGTRGSKHSAWPSWHARSDFAHAADADDTPPRAEQAASMMAEPKIQISTSVGKVTSKARYRRVRAVSPDVYGSHGRRSRSRARLGRVRGRGGAAVRVCGPATLRRSRQAGACRRRHASLAPRCSNRFLYESDQCRCKPLNPPPLPLSFHMNTPPDLCCVPMLAGLAAFPALVDGESTESRMARRQAYHACWGSLSAHIDVCPHNCS